ncbi:MAG: hypothetical protein GWO24_30365, partial [Akkermansiaceae bacterium]|nr:hypothetical protein [Akkermansiaceae bacterium]
GGATEEVRIDNIIVVAGLESDTDEDGLNDAFELLNGLDHESDAGDDGADGDPDGDGVSNIDEQARGSSPNSEDTDGDGLLDGVETNTGTFVDANDTGTDPSNADTDGDGLTDNVETNTGTFVDENDTGSDPHNVNTDGDNLDDFAETQIPNRDPNDPTDQVSFYVQDFDFPDDTTDLGDGSDMAGTAVVIGGALRMTTNTNSNNAAFHIPNLPESSTGFTAKFSYSIMDNTGNPPADGFAFNYGGLPWGGLST